MKNLLKSLMKKSPIPSTKAEAIDAALYSFSAVLIVYAVLLFVGFMWVQGPELGVLLAVICCHAIFSSVKGVSNLMRYLAWLR